MIIEIYNKKNTYEYRHLLNSLNLELDIYYQPEFLDIEATLHEKSYFEIFTVFDSFHKNIFIYPYIKIPILNFKNGYFDISSPYGYAGPYCNDPSFFELCEKLFLDYIKSEKTVSEFIRYHFIYNKENKFSKNITNEKNRTLVVFDLQMSWENIWKNCISQNNRNYINKFTKEGYIFEIVDNKFLLEKFIVSYYDTMQNADATQYFFFPKEYFYNLFENLNGKVMLGRIIKDDITFSSVIFFISGGFVHPYLNARNLNFPKIPSSVPLYINLAKWAKERELLLVNMGGGITASNNDSLFQFKKHLSNVLIDFHIGKRIHNIEIYNEIVLEWEKKFPEKKDKYASFLLKYRY
jgi:hypothetical protein